MTLPGETEAGSAGMQPCRGIAWWAHRNDVSGRGSSPFALFSKTHRIGRPLCLENPRPEGAEYSLTESDLSPFHAEPEQKDYQTVPEARAGIEKYFRFYNQERLHQSLEYRTPAGLYLARA